MQAPCVVTDNGTGTASLPPDGCGYVSPQDLHMMIDGLPAGTTIEVAAEHDRFFNVTATPGGSLGGAVETFDSFLTLDMEGTGALAGYVRTIQLPINCETHTGPRTPGAAHQAVSGLAVRRTEGAFAIDDGVAFGKRLVTEVLFHLFLPVRTAT